jgi:hypothetical protein
MACLRRVVAEAIIFGLLIVPVGDRKSDERFAGKLGPAARG